MAFFDKISEKASMAAKKSSDLIEISKINRDIGKEQEDIGKLFFEIGQKYYLNFRDSGKEDIQFKDLFDAIKQHEENIKIMNNKIEELKAAEKCANCGNELEPGSTFCTKCGSKVGEVKNTANNNSESNSDTTVSPNRSALGEAEHNVKCSNCGNELEKDSMFCTHCGQKVK